MTEVWIFLAASLLFFAGVALGYSAGLVAERRKISRIMRDRLRRDSGY